MSGKKKSFDAEQCKAIDQHLLDAGRHRDLAFFRLAVSSMGLCSELLSLRVSDILDERGHVSDRFYTGLHKSQSTAHLISKSARSAIQQLIMKEDLTSASYLFGGRGNHSKPYFTAATNHDCKGLGQLFGIDPADYTVCGGPVQPIFIG